VPTATASPDADMSSTLIAQQVEVFGVVKLPGPAVLHAQSAGRRPIQTRPSESEATAVTVLLRSPPTLLAVLRKVPAPRS